MITKEQQLALNSKGYDLVFEWKNKPYAIKTESLAEWSEEKKERFRQESGLDFTLIDDEWIFFNPEQYGLGFESLRYVGNGGRPDQPINCTNFVRLFYMWDGESLDLSHWDVSQVTQFDQMFQACKNLKSLDLTSWDVGKGEGFNHMFAECVSLKFLDLSGWNISNGKELLYMFAECKSLQSLDLSSWDVSNIKKFFRMFCNCKNLKSLDLSTWNVNNCKDFRYMFENTGIAEINEKSNEELVDLLVEGRWSEVKQGSIQDTLQAASVF